MADPVSSFRLAFADHKADFRMNLQFFCDHYGSVSEVCRRLAIHRQQFNRYLTGSAIPSRYNQRLTTNFFRLEDEDGDGDGDGDVLVSSVIAR